MWFKLGHFLTNAARKNVISTGVKTQFDTN